jgi:hypothetical protein
MLLSPDCSTWNSTVLSARSAPSGVPSIPSRIV